MEAVVLESDLLRTFVAVHDTGSFTRAAGIVGRTQSAVSLQIKRLEELIGHSLFERGPRGVRLTQSGRELLENARRVVSLLDETAGAFRTPALQGRVRIGLPEEYGHAVLGQALSKFARLHPSVDITARYGRSDGNMAGIDRGDLDLAVVFDWQDRSDAEVLMIDPTVWTTSDAYGMHKRTPLPIALYTNSGWCTDFALKSLEKRNAPYRVVYTSDTSGGLKLAVSSGLAITPLSRSNIPVGCRELTADEGFSQIDASRVVLKRNPRLANAAVEGMAEALQKSFEQFA
ncbi:LysR family transcriptional regulator [Aureimonas leprariae]|uniref:LysR family transcriptional regulator n=1 Tax=Plantimonas leprariae TaxID=2615207 RepID=A0A7V7TV43_9HYPH|nr:LysR family transcriptional regulator [Aureimonas leprariae]KAB0677527.1 LysR family transcriptional regulator [Aureimonas leprariae]